MGIREEAERAEVLSRSIPKHNKYFVTGTYGDFAVSCYEGEELVDVVEGFLLEDTAVGRAFDMNEELYQKQLEKLEASHPLEIRVNELEAIVRKLVTYVETNGLLEQNPFSRSRNEEMIRVAMKILNKGDN